MIAASGTRDFIACLPLEDNQDSFSGRAGKRKLLLCCPQARGEVRQSPVEYFARGDLPARGEIEGRGFPGGAVPMVSFMDRAATPAHVLVRFLDRESVLLNLETEQYFGLDETGTRIWQLVTASSNIDAAYQELLAEFDVEPELLRSNLMELLSRLVDSGLLQVLPADVGTAPAI
jgi:hypothetical protein